MLQSCRKGVDFSQDPYNAREDWTKSTTIKIPRGTPLGNLGNCFGELALLLITFFPKTSSMCCTHRFLKAQEHIPQGAHTSGMRLVHERE